MGLVEKGVPNLVKHVVNANKFSSKVVVTIRKFKTDTEQKFEQ